MRVIPNPYTGGLQHHDLGTVSQRWHGYMAKVLTPIEPLYMTAHIPCGLCLSPTHVMYYFAMTPINPGDVEYVMGCQNCKEFFE